MVDLRTRYLGLTLTSPLVASAGPLTGDVDRLVELERHGIGAIVMPSLFAEEITRASLQLHLTLQQGRDQFAESLDYLPELPDYDVGPERYLARIGVARSRLSVPVIASLNASAVGDWVDYAKQIQDAGASALELNLYEVHADPTRTGAEVEAADLALIAAVRAAVSIPLAVKLSPYYSAFAHFAHRVADAGADGLVLFNRFYQPDLDLETLGVRPSVELSSPWEMRLPLRWIGLLRDQLSCSLAATSGIHDSDALAKVLLVGADVGMSTSALLRHGTAYAGSVLAGLRSWMAEAEYESVEQLKGSVSRGASRDPEAFERANYMQTLASWGGRGSGRGSGEVGERSRRG